MTPFAGLQRYLDAVRSFGLNQAIPNLEAHPYHYHVDPYEPQRVWFMTRATGQLPVIFSCTASRGIQCISCWKIRFLSGWLQWPADKMQFHPTDIHFAHCPCPLRCIPSILHNLGGNQFMLKAALSACTVHCLHPKYQQSCA